ncbi:L-rhamnose mutarotase [Metabacillus arenae]|uniref:L-rhamnose mutarotase n=1 Tax=Metabacillus arenae TaxID=2771434 RepID=A0A926NS20_9BACI|nr:L-rhamnose mutarotase [Metabacillus arenae]MBD1382902.1 L-rhamnose mutarotase [Metabacillus arenae]
MIRKAFVMTVHPDKHDEYEKRHNEIWPEMIDELQNHGTSNYSIFLDKETSKLFGYVEIDDEELWSKIALAEMNKKWWKFMEPLMETNPDKSPVTKNLRQVFHMD